MYQEGNAGLAHKLIVQLRQPINVGNDRFIFAVLLQTIAIIMLTCGGKVITNDLVKIV